MLVGGAGHWTETEYFTPGLQRLPVHTTDGWPGFEGAQI